jgi:N-acetyl-alpha-D-glucosaminyl L-malate synthase BshA
MRIGIVCLSSIGGSGLVATQLGLGLAQLGHEVHFISRTRPFKLLGDFENVFFHSVEAIQYPLFPAPLYTFALTAKIVEVAERYSLDVVHAHYSIPHSLCAYLACEISQHKFPIITTIHGTDVSVIGRDKPLYPLNQFSINKSNKVTTVSAYQRDYIRDNFDNGKPIEVIHNFINLEVFSPANASVDVRRTLAHDDEKIVMHVSNFRPLKNIQGVIRTFHKTLSQINARLILLGSGPEIDGIKKECQALGITDKVNFMGDVTHVQLYLANADCIIHPSYRESFGMVVLEAMACAVPTVTSNVDGIPEVVEHGITGFMAAPDDIDSLSNYIVKVLTDAELQRQMGHNGRERAAYMFNPEAKIEQYLRTYKSALVDFSK